MKKLNNLLTFKDFNGNIPKNDQKKTKRTDVGLDILNEKYMDRGNFDLSLEYEDLPMGEKKRWAKHVKKERPGDYQMNSPKAWWNDIKHIDKK